VPGGAVDQDVGRVAETGNL